MQNMYVSPCRQVCKLNRDDVCVGCGRTIKEITEWPKYHHYQRMKIMERLGYGRRRGRPNRIRHDVKSS